jgi:hypothetical protein
MNNGKINRAKGHNAERYYAKIFRNLGFDKVQTSRYGNRLHDDAGIDLVNLPINVQIKAGKQKGLNITNTLQYTKDRIKELLPKEALQQTYPTILIHKKDIGKGKQKTELHEIVSMSFKDFIKILKYKYEK